MTRTSKGGASIRSTPGKLNIWTCTTMSGRASVIAAGLVAVLVLLLLSAVGGFGPDDARAQSSVRPPSGAASSSAPPPAPADTRNLRTGEERGVGGNPFRVPDPTAGKGAKYDTQMWLSLRKGTGGKVSIPDGNAGRLIQSDGWKWMKTRNGALQHYGGWALGGTILLLAVFFLFKGRIKIEGGRAGRSVLRFSFWERMTHWLLAGSFIILALSGLNMLYGKALILPLVGKPLFATLTAWGKLLHNYVAFSFMVGLVMIFLMWVWHNFPTWRDVVWIVKLGGAFGHAPAGKFNAGQKILFWLIMLTGASITLSGLALMFPFQYPLFSETFSVLNRLGTDLPTALSPVQEMQYTSTWHAIMGLAMMCIILAHIYIGTIGMQGAFDAMWSGEVDINWAREHHDAWAEKVLSAKDHTGPGAAGPASGASGASGAPQPAE